MIALGLATAMTAQKHFVRPMDGHLISHVVLAALCYLLFWPRLIGRVAVAVSAAALGLALVVFASTERASPIADLFVKAPVRLFQNARLLADSSRMQLANSRRFSRERFQGFPQQQQLIDVLRADSGGPISVFALTDNATLYVMTGQPPVWVGNMYNTSPVYEQRQMVAWLDRDRPTYVVFDPQALRFDDVPTAVRVPLVVAAVAERYVPHRRVGRIEVARRRRADEPVALAYWREMLGASTDLGHIPALVDVGSRPACERPPCEHYLQVTVDGPMASAARASLSIEAGGLAFEITFAVTDDNGRYIVPLSHLWMWRVASAMGAEPMVSRPMDAGMRWEMLPLASAPDVLY
jgi:hypothetical protein